MSECFTQTAGEDEAQWNATVAPETKGKEKTNDAYQPQWNATVAPETKEKKKQMMHLNHNETPQLPLKQKEK